MVPIGKIRSFSARIAQEFRPERIILFGSHARRRPRPDSDVDLLVILRFRGHPARKAAEIRSRVEAGFPLDLLARTPAQVTRRLKSGDFFMQEVIQEGVTLYEATDG